jgi:hypothetical protein
MVDGEKQAAGRQLPGMLARLRAPDWRNLHLQAYNSCPVPEL